MATPDANHAIARSMLSVVHAEALAALRGAGTVSPPRNVGELWKCASATFTTFGGRKLWTVTLHLERFGLPRWQFDGRAYDGYEARYKAWRGWLTSRDYAATS